MRARITEDTVTPELRQLIKQLTNKQAFFGEWASKVARLARNNAVKKGSGGGFWEIDIAGSVRVFSVSNDGATVYTDDQKAVHKQFGGIIRAKKAKALTIPIAPEAKGKRVSELSGGDRTLLRIGDEGHGILGYSRDGKFHALYALRTSVTQKAEPWWPTDRKVENIGVKTAEKHFMPKD